MKRIQATRTLRLLGLAMILLALLALVLVLSPALAQEPTPNENVSSEAPGEVSGQGQDVGALWDDGGAWEVGAHSGVGGDLTTHGWVEAWGLYNKLGGCGWNRRYLYNKYWAWEEDFKRLAGPGGGKEWMYLDTVDLQFYVGHGGPGSFTFWNTCCDGKYLTTSDCYRSWGDNDNEWVALTSCQVLADSQLANWARCMKGTHLILGFKSNAKPRYWYWQTQGYQFAKYLCRGWRVCSAWFKAADRSQPSGRVVRCVINELAYLDDRPMCGSPTCPLAPDSHDWDAWVATHVAGSEPARYVNVKALQGTMPVFRTPPLSLDEAQNRYGNLGNAFRVPVTPTLRIQQDDDIEWVDVSDGRELEMDSTSGLYGYTDLNNMWTYMPTQMALTSQGAVIAAADARTIADQFLTANGLMPGDARFYEVVSDTISGGDIVSGTVGEMTASLLADEQSTVWQVIYSRVLTYTLPSVMGIAQDPIEFSVVGPGAKQKVYVSTNAGLASLSGSPILGAMGGWREIEQRQVGGGISAQMVNILPLEQIYMLHEQLEKVVVLDPLLIEADSRTIISHTVAYWENGAGTPQAELIPAYALTVSYTLQSELVAVDQVHIPANPRYMRPFARIESGPTDQVQVGQEVSFTAADATRTLADLGYDASLNFALGYGDPDYYIYNWYVNSVDDANLVGTGRSISYTVTSDVTDRAGSPQQTIILEVTDTANPDQPSTTDSWSLDVYPRTFVPLLLKDYAP